VICGVPCPAGRTSRHRTGLRTRLAQASE